VGLTTAAVGGAAWLDQGVLDTELESAKHGPPAASIQALAMVQPSVKAVRGRADQGQSADLSCHGGVFGLRSTLLRPYCVVQGLLHD
jgi:hypothetical protein